MQKATQKLQRISANTYDKHNYKDMVLRCPHLNTEQQRIFLDLFSQYEELYSRTLGAIPNYTVNLKLKADAKPYFAKAYSIPQSIYQIAKDEVDELTRIGVLIRNQPTPWVAPCLFRPKKDGGVRFLTDFRKLNEQLERTPYPLPNIDDVIFSLRGFTFATCLDLNRGYYHFVLDKESQKLCGISLLWGQYCYGCLPQGCKPSSDIFQCFMQIIFANFEDIISFIDNILLFTKLNFEHHANRLKSVLQVVNKNNLHIHIKGTYLAVQKVDYLGYTLRTTGVES
jgi:hypothetical protein